MRRALLIMYPVLAVIAWGCGDSTAHEGTTSGGADETAPAQAASGGPPAKATHQGSPAKKRSPGDQNRGSPEATSRGFSATAYASRANGICARHAARLNSLGLQALALSRRGDISAAAGAFDRAVRQGRREIDALGALPAPAQHQAVLSRMLDRAQAGTRNLAGAVSELRAGRTVGVLEQIYRGLSEIEASKRIATALGLDACGAP